MKGTIFFILFILFIFNASALSITTKSSFNQGETLIATIEGNILEPIIKENIGFFEGHVQKPFTYGLTKINNIYYIYAIVPYTEKNYSLRIFDVYFKENNEFKTLDLEANFSVSNTIADFYVIPGFIVSKSDFEIELYNNKNSNINVNYEFAGGASSVFLPLQEKTILKVNTSNVLGTSLNMLILNSQNTHYEIPVYIIKNQSINQGNDFFNYSIVPNKSEDEKKPRLRFSADIIDEKLKIDNTYRYVIKLINYGNEATGKVSIKTSSKIKNLIELEIIEIDNLNPGEEREISFLLTPKKTGFFEGEIIAESPDSSYGLKIKVEVGKEIIPVSSVREEKSCSELNGKICLSNQICEGLNVPSSDNVFCCTGLCKDLSSIKAEEKSNNIAIVVVVFILLLIILFIGYRMKKSQNPSSKEKNLLKP
ncbi:MAG: hypothetical protein QW727_02575 [Candidatus Pacearchaeota archaeon]